MEKVIVMHQSGFSNIYISIWQLVNVLATVNQIQSNHMHTFLMRHVSLIFESFNVIERYFQFETRFSGALRLAFDS